MKRTTTHDDILIGQRIRACRNAIGLTQAALGEALGVSFQQVQKYEKGANRVASSIMPQLAAALGTTVPALFGLNTIEGVNPFALTMMASADGCALAAAFNNISKSDHRRAVLLVAQQFADAGLLQAAE